VKFVHFVTHGLIFSAILTGFNPPLSSIAAPLTSATVTETKNDVRHKPEQDAERPAKVADVVKGADVLRTGERSLSEIEFEDNTVTRLGSNTIFTFKQGTRDIEHKQGLILFHVPKKTGGTRLVTAAATAAITGTTGLSEAAPTYTKLIFLEGGAKVKFGRKTIKVKDTEMLLVHTDGKWFKAPIDLELLFKTSEFLKEARERLKELDKDGRIEKNLQKQQEEKRAGRLEPVPYYIVGLNDRLLSKEKAIGDLLGVAQLAEIPSLKPLEGAELAWLGPTFEANPGLLAAGFLPAAIIGIIHGQLIWRTSADLDLSLLLPSGPTVAWFNPVEVFNSGLATATLDADNLGSTINIAPDVRYENISVTGIPESGTYTFSVENKGGPTTDAIFRYSTDGGATVSEATFTLTSGGGSITAATVTFP
jgi:hypothetical protein